MPEQPTLIIDGHLDLAFNALHHRRDLTQDIPRPARARRPQTPRPFASRLAARQKASRSSSRGTATVSLPQMRQGCVGIALSTIMCRVQMPTGLLDDGMRTQDAAHAIGQAHLHYYKALEREGQLRFIRDPTELDAAIAAWQIPTKRLRSA